MDKDKNCGCDCGCGCDEEFETTLTLSLDDGTDVECGVLSIFPAGEKEYIALVPLAEADDEDGEVFLYRYEETEDGEPKLSNIEDDEEYEIVADAFDEMLDEMEYDEMDEDTDEEE
ncbi:DUF1292 domain-containing protein [Parasporobacterium paucivorans]|uniref:Uncharacterized protein n=1 Tax=Parasporobacterium paucivorans DSM 15970 TaxID=1122934 RepID=A0A1M6FN27_9FIRM|nr:DUF1292 domain-containing protein [Parasporobacterium paucivorans]SHI99158.1 Protein of unknown function [Parasporobacterium paucivorans DSM 15970]